jgi:hypothetical protein
MSSLRDPFDVTHKREDKFDYVTWSQVADRLDEAEEPWSFAVIQIGPDWVHGRLTIGERHYENIGYAENAEANWKKEPLKDAASDAFKRCAALAGVARYLYDKDDHTARPATRQAAPRPTAVPRAVDTGVPDLEEPDGLMEERPPVRAGSIPVAWQCPIHGESKLVPAGVSKRTGNPYKAFWACTVRDCNEKAS